MPDQDGYASACEESRSDAAGLIGKALNIAGFHCRVNIRIYCMDRYMYVDVFPNPFRYCDPHCDEGCAQSRFGMLLRVLHRMARRIVGRPPFYINPALIYVGVVRNGEMDYVPVSIPLYVGDVVRDIMSMDVLMLRFELLKLSVPVPKIDLSRFWRGDASIV